MIVEPVSTDPRSRLRRVARLFGLLAPAVLLGAVVAGGLVGAGPGDAGATRPPEAGDAAAGTRSAVGAGPTDGTGRPASDGAPAGFPGLAAGLRVRSAADALADRASLPRGRVVAVAGHLSIGELPPACGDPGIKPFDARCNRAALLADRGDSPFAGGGLAGIGPHLHLTIPAVVGVPPQAGRTSRGAGGSPLPVVVVGRFAAGDPAGCGPGERGCAESFEVDRFAWADGSSWAARTVIDGPLEVNRFDDSWRLRRDVARAALGAEAPILLTAYVRPATLARLNPMAAAALAGDLDGATLPEAVWYVRGLDLEPGPPGYTDGDWAPRVVWVVVDDATGEVIAAGAA